MASLQRLGTGDVLFMRVGRLRRYIAPLRYVPLRAIGLRLRRELRQRALVRQAAPPPERSITKLHMEAALTALQHSDFLAFSAKTRELTASVFSYDNSNDVLVFALSGDAVTVADVDRVPWTEPGKIPASDVNRCYFMSFAEQATLLDGAPEADLVRLDAYVTRLVQTAPLRCGRLTIPWQSLPAARRLVNLVAGLSSILGRDPSLCGRAEGERLITHVAILRDVVTALREDDLGYNHLATEMFAQCVADRLFGDAPALEQHAREFVETMVAQVGADGMQLERSATYQAHLLGHLDALIAGQILPEPHHAHITQLAATMRAALALMTHRDGNIAVFNDAAMGDGPSPAVLGVTDHEIEAGVHRLPVAGYARIEHGTLSAIFDAGPCGPDDNPGHAHADFLSFELDIGQARLFVDPGVASYKAGAERDACRSAANHNGPTFLGLEPIEFLGAFRIGRRGRGHFLAPPIAAALSEIAPGIGGVQDGFNHAGGRVARWLATPRADAMLVVDGWRGLPDRDARSAFLIEATNWLVEEASTTRVSLAHKTTREKVVLAAISGSFVTEEGLEYHPYGAKRSFPARRVSLTPDSTTGMLRSAALAILAVDQVNADFREDAERLANVLLARALDGGL